MSRGFTVVETIDLPIQQVWTFLSNLDNCVLWIRGVNTIEPSVSGQTEGVGIRYTTNLSGAGNGSERDIVITAWEPNYRLALTSEVRGVTATYEYTLKGRRETTEITLSAECSTTGLLRIIHPFLSMMMKRYDGDQLMLLKQAIEQSRY